MIAGVMSSARIVTAVGMAVVMVEKVVTVVRNFFSWLFGTQKRTYKRKVYKYNRSYKRLAA